MSLNERRRSSVTREVIQNNFPLIKNQIDLEKVAAALGNIEGMLTTDQLNMLWQRFTPEDERKSQLLEFVCQRGDERRDHFLTCLRESGYDNLASQLQSQFEEKMCAVN